ENLDSEGWFDEDGWLVRDWFKRDALRDGSSEAEFRVGREVKYHAKPAWESAYSMYLQFGRENGIYLTPPELEELQRKAEAIRKAFNVGPMDMLPPMRPPELGESFDAHQKLQVNLQLRMMTNYDAQYHLAFGEKDPQVILARKLLHEAERLFRKPDYRALPLYEQAWPLWIDVCMRYPEFAKVSFAQEDIYESVLHHLRLNQQVQPELFRSVMLGMAQGSVWPYASWDRAPVYDEKTKKWKEGPWVDEAQKQKIVTVRVARGPLETVAYYD